MIAGLDRTGLEGERDPDAPVCDERGPFHGLL